MGSTCARLPGGSATRGSTTLRFYAQFARPADQAAASLLSGQLAGLRKKEQLRELFSQQPAVTDGAGLGVLAAALARVVGVEHETALAYLTEFSEVVSAGPL